MTKFMTESERPMQKPPSLSVFYRVLLSLLLLGGAALLFRAGLKPITGGNLALESFQEPLQGAKTAQVSLVGRSADVQVGVQALAGLALVGKSYFPQNIKLIRSTRLEGKTLWVNLIQTLSSSRFTFGLSFNNRSPRWNVQLNRELPTDLKVVLGSGDTVLNLEGANLESLNARVGSGEMKVTLPDRLEGDVFLSSGSGDLRVDTGLNRSASPEPINKSTRITAQSASGEQFMDLSQTDFDSVQAQSGSGNVSILLPNRSRVTVQVKTGSGDLLVKIPAGLETGTLRLLSGSGNITVLVSPEVAVRATVSRNLEDFQAPRGYALLNGVYLSPAALEGKPALNLNLGSSSGEIKLITEEGR